jgi:hypothetical protein
VSDPERVPLDLDVDQASIGHQAAGCRSSRGESCHTRCARSSGSKVGSGSRRSSRGCGEWW